MPDFFDRLVARSAGPNGGSGGTAAAASEPERPAGMAVARPRVPGLFERPAPRAPEQEWEAEAAPPLGPVFMPPLPAAAPATSPQRRTRAELVRPPVAYRGAERESEPDPVPTTPAALLSPAVPDRPAPPAGKPAVPAAWPDTAIGILVGPGPELGGGPDAPAPALPTGAPAPGRRPRVPAVPARRQPAASQPGRETTGRQSQAAPPAEPAVQIRIGRIEVRASDPPGHQAPARRTAARPGPVLSLDRFLAGEGGRR
jgi:hypothetical protein